jgi:hypothetical protein
MSIAIKWGLITGMVLVVQSLISNLLGIGQDPDAGSGMGILISAIGLIATFMTIYMGIKEIRDTEMGYMTTGLALRKGLKIALIAGAILAVFTIIYAKIIDPGLMDRVMAAQEEQMMQRNMTEEQIEGTKKVMSIFKSPFLTAGVVMLMTCFWAIFQSLIAGAMLKKEAPPTVPPSTPSV